jgi:hypothetical protein
LYVFEKKKAGIFFLIQVLKNSKENFLDFFFLKTKKKYTYNNFLRTSYIFCVSYLLFWCFVVELHDFKSKISIRFAGITSAFIF